VRARNRINEVRRAKLITRRDVDVPVRDGIEIKSVDEGFFSDQAVLMTWPISSKTRV